MICEAGVGYGSRPLRKEKHSKVESEEKEAETRSREGGRKGEGRKLLPPAMVKLTQTAISRWLVSEGVEPMLAGGAHHYRSRGMCLLRSSADSTISPQGGGDTSCSWKGPHEEAFDKECITGLMEKCIPHKKKSPFEVLWKMGPKMLSQTLTGGCQRHP